MSALTRSRPQPAYPIRDSGNEPQLKSECTGAIFTSRHDELRAWQTGGVHVGDAKLTQGYRLPAKFVVHTVGQVWRGGQDGEPDLLASCYRRAIELAASAGARTIAFPCISTGVYGYPFESAAQIAIASVRLAITEFPVIEEVIFSCFSAGDLAVYERYLQQAAA